MPGTNKGALVKRLFISSRGRLAVSGSSAGGYLALLSGLYVEPKPNVILPIYPITDPLGWFFITPQPPAFGRPILSEEELAEYLDPNAEAVANCVPSGDAAMHWMAELWTRWTRFVALPCR